MTDLRVLHAVRSDGFAGVERHVAGLAQAQAAAGNSVAVIGGDPAQMGQSIGDPRVRHRKATTVLDTAVGIDRWRQSDVLHVHMTAAEIAAVMALRSRRVPVVSTRHFGGVRGRSPAGRLAVPLVQRRIAAQIAISEYVAGKVEGDSTVVYPGVPTMPEARPARDRTASVLVVQRLEPEKQTEMALRAFARAGLCGEGWRLDIAGAGSQRARLESLAADLGIADSVRFLGHRSDVPALMKQAGLLIAPCEAEGLGLTVLEAMAVGLPVVAVGSGGHLETVGLAAEPALYEPGDESAAAHLLAQYASDERRRDRLGAELQQLQRKDFTLQAQARATDAVYRSVL